MKVGDVVSIRLAFGAVGGKYEVKRIRSAIAGERGPLRVDLASVSTGRRIYDIPSDDLIA